MAKSRTSFKGGKQWSGNRTGRPPVPQDIKMLRALNRVELERMINGLVFLPTRELQNIDKSSEAPHLEKVLAKILLNAHRYGSVFNASFILSYMVPRIRDVSPPAEEPPATLITATTEAPALRTFEEFVERAGYPRPFPKQLEMRAFGIDEDLTRLLLGSRNYGKTDYITILGAAYKIYCSPQYKILIITKENKRVTSIVSEIANALLKNDVQLEKNNNTSIRVEGLMGKDHSIEGLSIRSGLRGRHPDMILMDDPVTDEDVSEATRKQVERKYNECHKLCSNICIIGQPAHQHDLYARLRNLVKKLEVPHGTIKELDHDLDAQRAAGVSEESISASYHLKILTDGQNPFDKIKHIDKFPTGDTAVAFIDPSFEGGDYTAISIIKAHFDGVAVAGFVWKKAWNHCLESHGPKKGIAELCRQYNVKRLCFETNSLGDMPIQLLGQALPGVGVVGRKSNNNKHSRIMAAGTYAHLIHLSRESDKIYHDQVTQYEYDAEHDDAPDSLATGLEWIGLIRGKV